MTQGDVIRADSKDIPRIFQLLYAGEGEARKADEQMNSLDVNISRGDDKPGMYKHKGHEFLLISYHMPTTCEVCPKPLWNMFRPPPALECRSQFWFEDPFIFLISFIFNRVSDENTQRSLRSDKRGLFDSMQVAS